MDRIQCIALDLDRTLLDREGRLSTGNRKALQHAMHRGVHVVIASGRALDTIPREVLELPGLEYAITSNGAAVFHTPTGRCVKRHLLPPRAALEILNLTEADDVTYEAFVDGKAYIDKSYVEHPERYGASPEAVEYVRATRSLEEDIKAFLRAHCDELDSMDVVVRDRDVHQRLRGLLERHVEGIYITSSVPQLLEISHICSGKHHALRDVLALLNVPEAACAAFGDGDNDAEMLAYAGHGVAMENASPACRKAADHVTRAHWEDGVAYGIHHILGI